MHKKSLQYAKVFVQNAERPGNSRIYAKQRNLVIFAPKICVLCPLRECRAPRQLCDRGRAADCIIIRGKCIKISHYTMAYSKTGGFTCSSGRYARLFSGSKVNCTHAGKSWLQVGQFSQSLRAIRPGSTLPLTTEVYSLCTAFLSV